MAELYGPVLFSFARVTTYVAVEPFWEAGPSTALETFTCFNKLSMCQTTNDKVMLHLEKASRDKIDSNDSTTGTTQMSGNLRCGVR